MQPQNSEVNDWQKVYLKNRGWLQLSDENDIWSCQTQSFRLNYYVPRATAFALDHIIASARPDLDFDAQRGLYVRRDEYARLGEAVEHISKAAEPFYASLTGYRAMSKSERVAAIDELKTRIEYGQYLILNVLT